MQGTKHGYQTQVCSQRHCFLQQMVSSGTAGWKDRAQSSPRTTGEVWRAWGGKLSGCASLCSEDINFLLRVSRKIGAFVSKPLVSLHWALIALTFSRSYLKHTGTCLLPRNGCVTTVCHHFFLCSFLTLVVDFNFFGALLQLLSGFFVF